MRGFCDCRLACMIHLVFLVDIADNYKRAQKICSFQASQTRVLERIERLASLSYYGSDTQYRNNEEQQRTNAMICSISSQNTVVPLDLNRYIQAIQLELV